MSTTSLPLSADSQPLRRPSNATTNANGQATFTFESPPLGQAWTGTLQLAGAPANASFIASIGTILWDAWQGASTGGPIQLVANDILSVAASGLVPNSNYLMWLIGSADPVGLAAAVWPEPSTALAQIAAGQPSVIAVATTFPTSVTIPALTRTLIIEGSTALGSPFSGSIEVTGTSVGFPSLAGMVYYNQPFYLQSSASRNNYLAIVPINPTEATITLGAAPAFPGTINVYGDVNAYPESLFYNGVPTFHATGVGGTVLATGPCRIVSASVTAYAATSFAALAIGTSILRADTNSTTGAAAAIALPPNGLIVQPGINVTAAITGTGTVSVAVAYP